MLHRWLGAILLAAAASGCGDEFESDPGTTSSGSPLDDIAPVELSPGNVRAFANASAPQIFVLGVALYAVVGLGNDPCPKVTDNGATKLIEGGCTTLDGQTVSGSAVVEQTNASTAITYQSFGYSEKSMCSGAPVESSYTIDGTFSGRVTGPGTGSFEVDLVANAVGVDAVSCAQLLGKSAYEYQGSLSGTETAEGGIDLEKKSTWAGSGRVGFSTVGRADVSTAEEVIDRAVCGSEALSGSTTLVSAGDTAVITYDGATDCETTATASYTINGAEQGELTGVTCNVGIGGRVAWPWLVLVVLGLAARRRR